MSDIGQIEIRTLAKDEKITEPGFYQIPIDRHHSQPCEGISVTSSILRTLETKTPAEVWDFHALNEHRWVRKETDALRMGKAMATFIEGGPEELENHYITLPSDKPRRPTEAQLIAYRQGRASDAAMRSIEYWAKIDADRRDTISESEWEMICSMGKVLARDPGAAAALGGIPEVTMAWQDEETGIWCLSRPDNLSFDGMITDYKKINTNGSAFTARLVDSRCDRHRYDMQMAFADEGFEVLTGHRPSLVGIVYQWDEPPHYVIPREIDDDDLMMGRFCNHEQIRTFAECMESGEWEDPGQRYMGVYRRNPKQAERILERMHGNQYAEAAE